MVTKAVEGSVVGVGFFSLTKDVEVSIVGLGFLCHKGCRTENRMSIISLSQRL